MTERQLELLLRVMDLKIRQFELSHKIDKHGVLQNHDPRVENHRNLRERLEYELQALRMEIKK